MEGGAACGGVGDLQAGCGGQGAGVAACNAHGGAAGAFDFGICADLYEAAIAKVQADAVGAAQLQPAVDVHGPSTCAPQEAGPLTLMVVLPPTMLPPGWDWRMP